MTIKIEDNIDDLTAISLVKQIIERGKISNYRKERIKEKRNNKRNT